MIWLGKFKRKFRGLNNDLREIKNIQVHKLDNVIDKELRSKIECLEQAMTDMRKEYFPILHPPRFKVGQLLIDEKFETLFAPYRTIEYSGKVVRVEQKYWYCGMGNEKHGWEYSIYNEKSNRLFEVADSCVLYSNTGVINVF